MSEKLKSIKELKEILLFESLDQTCLKEILEKFELVNYQMGESILLEEKIPNSFYIVLEGQVRQLVQNPVSKRTVTLATYNKGYLIGWSSFTFNKPIEFITAATDCKLLKISKNDFLNITNNFKSVLLKINDQNYPSLIWQLLKSQEKLNIPDKAKDFRYWIESINSKSQQFLCNPSSKWNDFPHKKTNWFLATDLEKFKIGILLNKEIFTQILELNIKSFQIIGLQKSFLENQITTTYNQNQLKKCFYK